MNIFKCLAVLHLVILSAPFVVSMNNEVDYLSTLPKPVIELIAKELSSLEDLENFGGMNKKINVSVKPELSRRLQKLSQEFVALCVDENLESKDLKPMVRMAQLCTIFNRNEKILCTIEDYESLNERVLYFIKKAVTRQILNSRQAAVDSLVRLVKNRYKEAISYANDRVKDWEKAKRSDFVVNRQKLIEVLVQNNALAKKNKPKDLKNVKKINSK